MKQTFIIVLSFFSLSIAAQENSLEQNTYTNPLEFVGDFRFRIEHDWNSIRSNGLARDDRSRLRYRLRFGFKYSFDKHSTVLARLRTGNINNQQGPHVTLGGGIGEFGLTQIGFEKMAYQYQRNKVTAWIGKNDIPLYKLNELFWNDNVFPEGVAIKFKTKQDKDKFLNQTNLNLGHFVIRSNNLGFNSDSYLQVFQLDFKMLKNKLHFFPGFYRFKNVANLPDGAHSFFLDYGIVHLGLNIEILPSLNLGVEYYNNVEDYSNSDTIFDEFKDQKQGLVFTAKYGNLKEKGNWSYHIYYANIEKFAIVDYFAQNDWVRWDYSDFGSSASRISNFQGVELRVGYAISKEMNLSLRAYFVEQLIPVGFFNENGSRVRLDFNASF